ncbi:uncharacterized protein AB9X84_009302 isoform 2-T2 [Acanthopagrus schlegelii]
MEEKVNGNVASWTYRQEKHQANGKKRVFAGVPVAYVVAGTLHFREMGRIVTSELKLQRDLLSCFRVANSFLSHRCQIQRAVQWRQASKADATALQTLITCSSAGLVQRDEDKKSLDRRYSWRLDVSLIPQFRPK